MPELYPSTDQPAGKKQRFISLCKTATVPSILSAIICALYFGSLGWEGVGKFPGSWLGLLYGVTLGLAFGGVLWFVFIGIALLSSGIQCARAWAKASLLRWLLINGVIAGVLITGAAWILAKGIVAWIMLGVYMAIGIIIWLATYRRLNHSDAKPEAGTSSFEDDKL
jgi:hypothetical protein